MAVGLGDSTTTDVEVDPLLLRNVEKDLLRLINVEETPLVATEDASIPTRRLELLLLWYMAVVGCSDTTLADSRAVDDPNWLGWTLW